MCRKKTVIVCLICFVLWISAGAAWAGTGGSEAKTDGQSEIWAGVVVDYMGKLRFLVLEEGTSIPIPGASIEIYIPSLDRYVLFGVTDENGIFELDVACGMNAGIADGTVHGSLLYLNSNEIQYRVYKAEWLPYPYTGSTILQTAEVPQTITVYLHKDKKKPDPKPDHSSDGDSDKNKEPGTEIIIPAFTDPEIPRGTIDGTETGGIPKTGVEGTAVYWLAGLAFFVLAGVILCFLMKKESNNTEEERRE